MFETTTSQCASDSGHSEIPLKSLLKYKDKSQRLLEFVLLLQLRNVS